MSAGKSLCSRFPTALVDQELLPLPSRSLGNLGGRGWTATVTSHRLLAWQQAEQTIWPLVDFLQAGKLHRSKMTDILCRWLNEEVRLDPKLSKYFDTLPVSG